MRLSVRGLLIWVAVASVLLALSRTPWAVVGDLALLVVIFLRRGRMDARLGRFMLFGALGGLFVAVAGLVWYVERTYGEEFYRLRQITFDRNILPTCQVGLLCGITLGFTLESLTTRPRRSASVSR